MAEHLRIAWGITGAGHFMEESFAAMRELKKDGHSVTTFLSRAGEEVARMYGVFDDLEEISDGSYLNETFLDSAQGASFPKIGRFNLKRYDVFILSPATSNTVAKIVNGIADTLVTNCAAQAMKSDVLCFIVPVDQESDVISELPVTIDRLKCEKCEACPPAEECPDHAITAGQIDLLKCKCCETCIDLCLHGAISKGEPVPLRIRKIDARNTRQLTEMDNVIVLDRPKYILDAIRKNSRL